MSVSLLQYFCIAIHKQTRLRSRNKPSLEGQTDGANNNPSSGLHLQFRFPPLTGKGIVMPFFSQIKWHRAKVICFVILKYLLEFPGKVEALDLASFTQGTMVEPQLY